MSIGDCKCLNEAEKDLLLFAVEEQLYRLEEEIKHLEEIKNEYPKVSLEHHREAKTSAHNRFTKLARSLIAIDTCSEVYRTPEEQEELEKIKRRLSGYSG